MKRDSIRRFGSKKILKMLEDGKGMRFRPNGRPNWPKHDQPICPKNAILSFLEFQGTIMTV